MKNSKIYLIVIALAMCLILGVLKGGNKSIRGNGLLSLFPENVQGFFNKNIIGS